MDVTSEAELGLCTPETTTVLVTLGDALLAMLTVNEIGLKLPPSATELVVVQVRVASVQLHPVPLIAVAVSPEGSVSVTVTVPAVAWVNDSFFTVMVYVLLESPCVQAPECVFVTDRSLSICVVI